MAQFVQAFVYQHSENFLKYLDKISRKGVHRKIKANNETFNNMPVLIRHNIISQLKLKVIWSTKYRKIYIYINKTQNIF